MTEGAAQEPTDDPTPHATRARRRAIRIAVFGIVAIFAVIFVLPRIPHEQQLRLHFGVGSSRIVRATARVGRGGVWDREKTWNFDRGAPSSLSWSFELSNGVADVEVELASQTTSQQRAIPIELEGGGHEANVELADATRGLE